MGEKFEWGEHRVSDDEIILAGYDTRPTLDEAQAFCTQIAPSHYENFLIANKFTPPDKRQHIENIYAFCRFGDDLGDDSPHPDDVRWKLLDEWEADLARTYGFPDGVRKTSELSEGVEITPWSGTARHPILSAIAHTSSAFGIPYEPYWKLIQAFKMDQTKKRYADWDELRQYCYYSADPVGHLFLYVYGHDDQKMRDLADYTCTALQLANHWQDVARDLDQERIYMPLDEISSQGYSLQEYLERRDNEPWRKLVEFQVERAREWFTKGKELWNHIDPRLAVDLAMFTMGGEAILNSIERQGYDTWRKRPTVGRVKQFMMYLRVRRLWKKAQMEASA